MEIKFNKQNILKNAGIECRDEKDYINYMKIMIEYLESHNKNYTQKQYFDITQIQEILQNIEFE